MKKLLLSLIVAGAVIAGCSSETAPKQDGMNLVVVQHKHDASGAKHHKKKKHASAAQLGS